MKEPQELLLRARRFSVVRIAHRVPDGSLHQYEVVQHPGAVVILPLVTPDRVCLIRNYRVAVGETLWELPAGTLEPGEEPAVTAPRELLEETGYRAGRIEKLTEFFMSPGILHERMHLFLATELYEGQARPESGEEIETHVMSLDEALAMCDRGQVQDAKTLVGLLWYDRLWQRKNQ
ncbi:MAG TPA: NUDIX hydrolase [Pirellulales bacterium]|nr:NUDIX hydrolase [Pirellulales bacterium]